MEAQGEQDMDDDIKEIDDENIVALSRLLGRDVLGESAVKIVCGEMRSRRLACPPDVEHLDVVEEEGTESSGRPPSY